MKKTRFYRIWFLGLIVILTPLCIIGRYQIYDFLYKIVKKPIDVKESLNHLVQMNGSLLKERQLCIDSVFEDEAKEKTLHRVELLEPGYTCVLKPGKSFCSQVDKRNDGQSNTTYEIKNDFDLKGETIYLPNNVKLRFDGGILRNGILKGDDTDIIASNGVIFDNISIEGSWSVNTVFSNWFSDIYEINALKKLFMLTSDNVQNTVNISKGKYYVRADYNGDEIILIKSNTSIVLEGTIELKSNKFDNYQIFRIQEKDDISIGGHGLIIGDRMSHIGTTGESGHGIVLRQSSNIRIHDLTLTDFWGDAIAIGGAVGVPCKNVIVESCSIKRARRNGISIVYADKFKVSNCIFEGNEGTNPERAIDIEPNPGCFCTNGLILDNSISGKYGVSTALEGSGGNYIRDLLIQNNIIDCNADEYATPYGRSITLLGDPESVFVINNTIIDGGLHADCSTPSKNIVVKGNKITGKMKIVNLQCMDNVINSLSIQCLSCVFTGNIINANSLYSNGDGETALVANSSIVKNNTFNMTGDKYYFDCPVTSRKDSEISDNVINIANETTVRYLVRVLSGTGTIIENNKCSKDLTVSDMGIGTVVKYEGNGY